MIGPILPSGIQRGAFLAKGLRAQRSRIGLSQTDFGKLLGVSAQSIYSWESEKARPRADQIAKLVALRSLPPVPI